MKRFEFPLERVRRWRRSEADLEELKLRQMLGERDATEQRKLSLLAERSLAEASVLAGQRVNVDELAALDSFRRYVREQGNALEQLHRQQEEKIAKQRERMGEAKRRFELLDRLHQSALAEWQAGFNKEQEEMASELFLAKRNRDL